MTRTWIQHCQGRLVVGPCSSRIGVKKDNRRLPHIHDRTPTRTLVTGRDRKRALGERDRRIGRGLTQERVMKEEVGLREEKIY